MHDTHIIGYNRLARTLCGFTADALRGLDKRGKLPLSRLWHEGQRAFDILEVAQLRERIVQKDPTLTRGLRK